MRGCCPSSASVFCLLNIKFKKKKWIWIVTGRRWADCRPRVCPTDRFYEWSNLINISQHRRLQTNKQHDPTKRKTIFMISWHFSTSSPPPPIHTQGHTVQHTETHKASYECGIAGEWWEKSERVTDGADDKTTTRRQNAAKQSVWNRNMYSRQNTQTKQVLLQMSNRSQAMASNVNLFCKTMTATRTLATQPDKQTMTFTKTLNYWERRQQILMHSTS